MLIEIPAEVISLYGEAGLSGLVEVVKEQVAQFPLESTHELHLEKKRIAQTVFHCQSPVAQRLSTRMQNCGTTFFVFRKKRHSEGGGVCNLWVAPIFCESRHCPLCAPLQIKETTRRFWKAFSAAENKPLKFITLTVQNCRKGDLAPTLTALQAAWNRLRKDHLERNHGALGYISKREVTYNRNTETWHPHIHAVVDMPFMPKEILSALWSKTAAHQSLNAGPSASRIEAVHNSANDAYELAKYCSKPIATGKRSAKLWDELITAWSGQRAFASGGTLTLPKVKTGGGAWVVGTLEDWLVSAPQSEIDALTAHFPASPENLLALIQSGSRITAAAIERIARQFRTSDHATPTTEPGTIQPTRPDTNQLELLPW
jgi:hypothetical protein